ncbi:hypothetical protein L6164_033927 [Bauhinia variegata]|uniref:Uncharacterized protein n=1 Tax=Bauhinia variegata TaxID=167791 RepID=A0ACB9KTT1_BAUVA|nr:hypothetical protein L6164_033927 [Bauhinia variegata]
MREAAVSLTKRLAQTAQETFDDFEEANVRVQIDRRRIVQQHANQYKRISWAKMLSTWLYLDSLLTPLYKKVLSSNSSSSILHCLTVQGANLSGGGGRR